MTARKIFLYMPILSVIYFYLFCIGVIMYLGYIPQYNNPDPNNVLNELPIFTVYMGFFAGLVSACWHLRYLLFSRQFVTLVTIGQIAGFVAIVYFDPGGMFEWFLD